MSGHDVERHQPAVVMPALVAGIHVFRARQRSKTWMAGTSPAMTLRASPLPVGEAGSRSAPGEGLWIYDRSEVPHPAHRERESGRATSYLSVHRPVCGWRGSYLTLIKERRQAVRDSGA